jgi:maleate isomerase
MFGWRAKIGLIHPGRGKINIGSIEMQMAAPEGVFLSDFYLDGPKSLAPEHINEVWEQLEPAAREVNRMGVDVITQQGVPICLIKGPGGDKKIIDIINKTTGVPATTDATSMIKALQHLQVKKVVVVAPYYTDLIADLFREFLEASDLAVTSMVHGQWKDFNPPSEIPQHEIYRLAKKTFLQAEASDGLLIAGGAAPTHSIIELLEIDLGKPVVSLNFASLWDVLRMANVRQPIKGYGKLLTTF